MKIMLADDEESIRKVVEHIVLQDGHDFCYAGNGLATLATFYSEKPDLLILDVMMPEINGFDVCAQIRRKSSVPIIFLSAKGDIVDKSIGFKMGADDYLVKPFSSIELSLRINALLTRSYQKQKPILPQESIRIGDLEIFHNRYEVYLKGAKLELTSKEFEILSFMASHEGQVFTREQLLDKVWGENYIGDINTITVFIRKLREKLEDNPAKPKYLLTVWGVGYKFAPKG